MNKFLLSSIMLLLSITNVYSNSDYINFQAVIRDSTGIVPNKQIGLRISLFIDGVTGQQIFREVHHPTTDANGIATIQIGNGQSTLGSYKDINWAVGDKFIQVECSINNNSNYTIIGSSQLVSVPLALMAKNIPDSLKYTAGDGIAISSDKMVTNSKPDREVTLTGSNGIAIKGKYPNFTIEGSGSSGGGAYTAGDGISISNNKITNTKPDQTISLTAGNGINISGVYPNWTITNTGNGTGGGSGLSAFDSTDLLIKGANVISSGNCNTALNGSGARMLWFGAQAAFRAGWTGDDAANNISHSVWDCDSVGLYSAAFGNSNLAKGFHSFAIGKYNRATGMSAFAAGNKNVVSGLNSASFGSSNILSISASNSLVLGTENTIDAQNSLALGASNYLKGAQSLANGESNEVHGQNSAGIGYGNYIFANSSVAIGAQNIIDTSAEVCFIAGLGNRARGLYSIALGNHLFATGNYSVAIGSLANTDGKEGAFVFSDASSINHTMATANNQMTMRFSGGYRLYSNSNSSIGVTLAAGSNAFSTISDSTKKENFLEFKNNILDKIAEMKIGSWNYKEQSKDMRHYGVMAQEFYSLFGKDDYGTIGCDTLINSADMDGLMMVAIKQLILENKEQKKAIENMQSEMTLQNEAIMDLMKNIEMLKKEIQELKKK